MRTMLSNNALHRLRHIVAEQANDAQAGGQTDYLHLDRLDAQDVADALDELVDLRRQEEDAASVDTGRRAVIDARLNTVDEDVDTLEDAFRDLVASVNRLREAVEG